MDHGTSQDPGLKLNPGASAFHQRIILNNSYAHDEPGDNHRQEKEGLMVSSIMLIVADILSSSNKVVSRAGAAKAESHGWPLDSAAHSTSQG